jgi:23S rRNA pseudouridine1911/1915/1917 synthase
VANSPSGSDPHAAREALVPKHLSGQPLDTVLVELFGGDSRSAWQKRVRRGEVKVDGARLLRSHLTVQKGQRIAVAAPRAPARAPASATEPVELFVDDELLIVDKPAGWLSHPADRASGPNLVQFVAARYGLLPEDPDDQAGLIHRLDRGTSGVIAFARTGPALEDLRAQFRGRTVDKRYLVFVHGAPLRPEFTIDAPLRQSDAQVDLQQVGAHPRAKEAVTEVQLTERLGEYSLLSCTPRTGRRHQIRAHLHSVGLPVVGDSLYRARAQTRSRAPKLPRDRQALHAAELGFAHPRSGQPVRFRAPLPADLEGLLAELRARR